MHSSPTAANGACIPRKVGVEQAFLSGVGRTVEQVGIAPSSALASPQPPSIWIGSSSERSPEDAAAGMPSTGRNLPLTMLLTDAEISALLAEEKSAVDSRRLLQTFANTTLKDSHRRHSITVNGAAGDRFQLSLRQSALDPYDFSVILTVIRPDGSLNLRRHNGTSHAHSNPIEGNRFQGICHVHEATERYQRRGSDAEHFARVTSDFSDLATALNAMLRVANFQPPAQLSLEGS
jgi:hypothetical protein